MNDDTPDIEIQIQARLDENGQLTCKAAHLIAGELAVDPLYVGDQATAKGVRITRCQLGFFGYAEKKGMPGYKIVRKLDRIPEATATALRQAANRNDHGPETHRSQKRNDIPAERPSPHRQRPQQLPKALSAFSKQDDQHSTHGGAEFRHIAQYGDHE